MKVSARGKVIDSLPLLTIHFSKMYSTPQFERAILSNGLERSENLLLQQAAKFQFCNVQKLIHIQNEEIPGVDLGIRKGVL